MVLYFSTEHSQIAKFTCLRPEGMMENLRDRKYRHLQRNCEEIQTFFHAFTTYSRRQFFFNHGRNFPEFRFRSHQCSQTFLIFTRFCDKESKSVCSLSLCIFLALCLFLFLQLRIYPLPSLSLSSSNQIKIEENVVIFSRMGEWIALMQIHSILIFGHGCFLHFYCSLERRPALSLSRKK